MKQTAEPGVPVVRPLAVLMADLIDYAGLFPPAGLSMAQGAANYARYLHGPESWALGRFVLPASRLAEFEREWTTAAGDTRCRLSVLIAREEELEAALKFSLLHPRWISVESLEVRTDSADAIERFGDIAPPDLPIYAEVPLSGDVEPLIAAAAKRRVRGKVRTGGVVESAIPVAGTVARFLRLCAAYRVPFKATAGLHHPVRCIHALTYEPGSPRGTMHGFLNVFLAACLAWQNGAEQELEAILQEENPAAFAFRADGVHWRSHVFGMADVETTRKEFALSFGSCSFEEPMNDLRGLGLLG